MKFVTIRAIRVTGHPFGVSRANLQIPELWLPVPLEDGMKTYYWFNRTSSQHLRVVEFLILLILVCFVPSPMTKAAPTSTPKPTLGNRPIRVPLERGERPRPVAMGINVHVCIDTKPTGISLPPRDKDTVPEPPTIASDGSVSNIGLSRQPLAGYTELMWNTGQTLRVKMMGGSAFVRSKVRQFAEEWTKYADIKFDFVDSGWAEIKVAFDKGGSWSAIGRDALGITENWATMNFGWFDDSTSDTEFSRVVLHEFGHALGLIHEHQSPTSGIQWDKEKTYAYYKENDNWDRAEVDANVFQKYSVSSTNYSAFDPNSIMEYWVPAELTLDGKGVAGGTQLSATDKEYIGKWYPFPVTPANASGLLRTGDTCDEIDFTVEYNVVGANNVEFDLMPASGITWWKAIEVPTGGSGYTMGQMQDGQSATLTIAKSDLDTSRPMRFWKAKFFGVHTQLGFTWDVIKALPGGSRVTLIWKRDGC